MKSKSRMRQFRRPSMSRLQIQVLYFLILSLITILLVAQVITLVPTRTPASHKPMKAIPHYNVSSLLDASSR